LERKRRDGKAVREVFKVGFGDEREDAKVFNKGEVVEGKAEK